MNYSHTVDMHATKEKLRGILEKKNLFTYMLSKILIKISKEMRIVGKKENWMEKTR